MKKIVSFFFLFFLVLSMALPASAAIVDTVDPLYENINSVVAHFSINESTGNASCGGQVVAKSILPVKLVVALQRLNVEGNYWETVQTWSHVDTMYASLTGQYTIPDGYTYRVRATGYIYDATGTNIVESASAIKSIQFFS